MQENTWNMSYTDTGTTSSLSQSPLRSPTVFNFFYPGYEFPGALASAGLTTPEFQLTTDSGVAAQMNFIEGGILGQHRQHERLEQFHRRQRLHRPEHRPVDDDQLHLQRRHPHAGEQPEHAARRRPVVRRRADEHLNYVANTNNFAYSTPPTQTQMRDRVRAVVHLIASSPDFIIQK